MDRTKVQRLRTALNAIDLSEIENRFGVKFKIGNASYDSRAGNATFKLEVANIVGGIVKTKEVSAFELNAKFYGLEPTDLGCKFSFNGELYKIVGLKPRSRKYPILGENIVTGKSYKFMPEMVKMTIQRDTKKTKPKPEAQELLSLSIGDVG